MGINFTFAICIPTLNRFDLLLPSLLMYSMDYPTTSIYIYDNGKQNIHERLVGLRNVKGLRTPYSALSNVKVFGGTGENIGVAAAWNFLCDKAVETTHTHILMLNDDVYFGKNEHDLCQIIHNHEIDFWICQDSFDWSVFLMPKSTWGWLKNFDTNFFPAYYEDRDAEYRLNLLKFTIERPAFMNPVIFHRSMTLMKDPTILDGYKEKNKEYYIKKWGGDVGAEKFITPFGK